VRLHRAGAKRLHHPVVGDIESADALNLLASWAATTGPPGVPADRPSEHHEA
jgi:hypothetical protein